MIGRWIMKSFKDVVIGNNTHNHDSMLNPEIDYCSYENLKEHQKFKYVSLSERLLAAQTENDADDEKSTSEVAIDLKITDSNFIVVSEDQPDLEQTEIIKNEYEIAEEKEFEQIYNHYTEHDQSSSEIQNQNQV